ncbi:hypothetical protein [Streptomyces sp. CA-251251]
MSLAFLVTTFVVVATPGTGVVHTLAAARRSRWPPNGGSPSRRVG